VCFWTAVQILSFDESIKVAYKRLVVPLWWPQMIEIMHWGAKFSDLSPLGKQEICHVTLTVSKYEFNKMLVSSIEIISNNVILFSSNFKLKLGLKVVRSVERPSRHERSWKDTLNTLIQVCCMFFSSSDRRIGRLIVLT
jgi:hypothetical protein